MVIKPTKITNNTMPESRKRGGKKAHNKRLKKRKEQMVISFKLAQQEAWKKLEGYKNEKGSITKE